MPSFSQRIGLKPMQKALQTEAIDKELRNSLWSVLKLKVWDLWEPEPSGYATHSRSDNAHRVDRLIRQIWFNVFKLPIDTIPAFDHSLRGLSAYQVLRQVVIDGEWNQAYDLVEFIVQNFADRRSDPGGLANAMNAVLEHENAGYRLVNDELVAITSPDEIESFETAIEKGTREIREHFSQALSLLSDRKNPDYRNSIKESISAVEAAYRGFTGKPSATLGDCLKSIQSQKPLHRAFEGALDKLYGYAGDAGGIRHALKDESPKPTYADARFMLVSCSAFTNYLWTVAAELNIKIG